FDGSARRICTCSGDDGHTAVHSLDTDTEQFTDFLHPQSRGLPGRAVDDECLCIIFYQILNMIPECPIVDYIISERCGHCNSNTFENYSIHNELLPFHNLFENLN